MSALGLVPWAVIVGTVACAGWGHARHRARLVEALELQSVVSARWLAPLSLAVVLIELSLGAVGLTLALWHPASLAATATAAAMGLLFFLYAGYALFLLRRRPDAPCGCGDGTDPVNGWTAVRAVVLGVLAAVAAVVPASSGKVSFDVLTAVVAAAAVGLILWQLPQAMSVPEVERDVL